MGLLVSKVEKTSGPVVVNLNFLLEDYDSQADNHDRAIYKFNSTFDEEQKK